MYDLRSPLQDLIDALAHLYVGRSTFIDVFVETPQQALAALRTKPEAFGLVRSVETKQVAQRLADAVDEASKLLGAVVKP